MFIFTERRQQPTSYSSSTQTLRHNELYVFGDTSLAHLLKSITYPRRQKEIDCFKR